MLSPGVMCSALNHPIHPKIFLSSTKTAVAISMAGDFVYSEYVLNKVQIKNITFIAANLRFFICINLSSTLIEWR